MSAANDWRWIVPRSIVGKILLGLYLIAFGAVLVPLYGLGFTRPTLLGPFPEAVTWTYSAYAVMNAVLILTYVYLLRPWAEEAAASVGGSGDTARGGAPESTVSTTSAPGSGKGGDR